LLHLPVGSIKPNPRAPRQTFSDTSIDSLAESIKRWGQLQPVVVQREEAGYLLVFGERRWRAHQRAGLDMIWALERQLAESEQVALALVENLQRVGLSHAEKVAALDQLAEMSRTEGLRQTAQRIRITPGWLSSQLAVRRDPIIFPALEEGALSFGQAAELMRAPARSRRVLLDRLLQNVERTTTATIRAWVSDVRAVERHTRVADASSRYVDLLEQFQALPAPRTQADLDALRALMTTAEHRLRPSQQSLPVPVCAKSTATEIKCLMCGESAGAVVDGRRFRPRERASVRVVGHRLACGRCGGSLAPSERTEHYFY
jgi:ParB/RepB/Spo0J family partition protein